MELAGELPKGTPFTTPEHLSVMSYNLLAPLYVRPLDERTGKVQAFAAFKWAEPADEVLDWEVRKPRLLEELRSCQADVICLQEVQFESTGGDMFGLPPWLVLHGYGSSIPDQAELKEMADRNLRVLRLAAPVGNALLYRRDRLEVVAECARNQTTRVAVCVQGLAGGALARLGPTVVVSCHLDATSEDKRVKGIIKVLQMVREMGTREAVIVGDMNTECKPGSCVAALVPGASEPSEEELRAECASELRIGLGELPEDALQKWAELRAMAAAAPALHRLGVAHVATGPTRAGFDHDKEEGPCVAWRLDHIFFTPRTLQLHANWTALDADPAALEAGLPNRWCPSDHLPVAASFHVSPAACLSEAEAEAFLGHFTTLGHVQIARLRALEGELRGEQENVEAQVKAAQPPEPEEAQEEGEPAKKKKKSKGKGKPPPEVMAFMQQKRQRERDLKATLRAEREQFVAALSEEEHDMLDNHAKVHDWIEQGAKVKK